MRSRTRQAAATAVVLLPLALSLSACARVAASAGSSRGEARALVKPVEDVFLLSGELRAVRSESLMTPRGEGEMQIRWMVEDGSEVKAGDRLVEFDPTRLVQTIEDRRLRLRQAEIDRESKERQAAAEGDKKRVAVEKAEVEAEKARLEEAIPLEYREPKDRPKLQAQWQQARATLAKARLEREAYAVSSRSDVAAARAAEEKARREVAAAEKALGSMSVVSPRAGIFQVGNFWQWGPEGPRKLQPGDTVWPGFPVATIPDPSEMEVHAALSEADHGRIAAGMKARCILDTYPDRVFEGRVAEIGSVATEAGRRFFMASVQPGFPVRIALVRTDPLMRPGLSTRVEVVRGSWPKALSVPRGAVRFEKDGPAVRKGGTTVRITVRSCTPTECVVESGLAEGDRVALF